MLQTIQGCEVFVVDFNTMPDLPITWSTEAEKPYALALGAAISTGVITEPGKYGIHVTDTTADPLEYTIYTITE